MGLHFGVRTWPIEALAFFAGKRTLTMFDRLIALPGVELESNSSAYQRRPHRVSR